MGEGMRREKGGMNRGEEGRREARRDREDIEWEVKKNVGREEQVVGGKGRRCKGRGEVGGKGEGGGKEGREGRGGGGGKGRRWREGDEKERGKGRKLECKYV